MTRTVLIVSPHFPPSTLAGVHRARHMARHLPAHGWRPIIVRADEHAYTEPGDPGLDALVSPDLAQVRTGALPAALCRRFGFSDIGLRAYPFLARAIDRLAAAERPDVVFITGSPFYPMLLAGGVARRLGLPVVLDFQDPWVSAHGAGRPLASKAGLAHRVARALEPQALRHAAFVTSVSKTQNDQMAARYPWLDLARMAAIPIGGDADDFAALRVQPPTPAQSLLEPGMTNFSYVGTFLPRAGPLVETLFRALAHLRRQQPQLAGQLRINFIGTSNQPDGVGSNRVAPLAEAAGVADLVREHPRRIPYLDALGVLDNSDALLLIGSDEPHYTASKIYPALLSGRPYLSLFHRASSAHQALTAAGGGGTIAFENAAELEASIPTLAEALRALAENPGAFGPTKLEPIEPYLAPAIAGRFAAIFNQVSAA